MVKLYEYNRTYKGTVSITLQNENYEVDVLAKATYYYEPEVHYFSDGTGQPESEDLTVNKIIVDKILKENQSLFGVWDDVTDIYEKNAAFKNEILAELYSELEDSWYDYDWEGDDYDDYEPDYRPDED